MKRIVFTTVLFLGLGLATVWAGENGSGANVRYVRVPRFVRQLVEKWTREYAKVEPGVQFEIAQGGKSDADLNVVFDSHQAADADGGSTVFFGELAVLPITARNSEADKALEGKRLNTKKLRQLYFLDEDFEEEGARSKLFERLIIYSGSNASSVATPFAQNLGEQSSSFRGKRISGDDLYLNTAVKRDPLGVSFNTLPNIFDLDSRHVKSDLSLIGIDVKKSQEAAFSNEGTLDQLIAIQENGKVQGVAEKRVGFSYDGTSEDVRHFISWVLEYGVRYNHDYGLLNLDSSTSQSEKQKLAGGLTAQNNN